ncbi:MAG: malto-oligosyltrehalose synthase [Dehalococcoidia bacterium]|nr:malto-oligosyltrehalose synthase [Dehalococcoidia bacterium]
MAAGADHRGRAIRPRQPAGRPRPGGRPLVPLPPAGRGHPAGGASRPARAGDVTGRPPAPTLASTYRLQLHRGFTFDDARAVVPYLADLGVTHLYLSPITTAAPGSTHGYDVTDPTRLEPEFGGQEAYTGLVQAQQAAGLGQIVDIVPNHMGIAAGAGNRYWEDVLRHGRTSPHARIFDIDWTPPDPALRNKVLLPILGDTLDAALERGEVALEVDGTQAWLCYFDHRLPVSPPSLEAWRASGAPRSQEAVRALLREQHYRLGHWRTAKRDVNYRRFFAIDELIGIHTEDPEVFDLAHRLVLRLVRDGSVHGVRIDHPDGLFDPQGYLERLQAALAASGAAEAYVVLEKVLQADEPLPDAWDCDGSTGYDFMNEGTRVLVAAEHAEAFERIYREASGREASYEAVADECRADVVEGPLAGQFETLARRLHAAAAEVDGGAVSEARFVDALRALLPRIAVYRTYHREPQTDPRAGAVLDDALSHARRLEGADTEALERVARLLADPPNGAAREVVMWLQQIMPAVQAKGLEDRAFYRYRRLLALNEVGGDPERFGESVESFHRRQQRRAERSPSTMLSTATHDHKRGEDARARLVALSELPEAWAEAWRRATEALEPLQRQLPRRIHPDDVYLFVQTLLATDPHGMTPALGGADDFVTRLQDYLVKALREAGERTEWEDVDESYERAVRTLVGRALAAPSPLVEALAGLQARVAHLGAVNSLAQVVLRLASPGVTDTYQGNELWDFSLVDPDNRRPVDFGLRRALLDRLRPALEDGPTGDAAREHLAPRLLEAWRDGAVKCFVLARGLRVRRDLAPLFVGGSYEPLAVDGERREHAIAFLRRRGDLDCIVAVPRLPGGLLTESGAGRVGRGSFWQPMWGDTSLRLPGNVSPPRWRDAFTGAAIDPAGRVSLDGVLGPFPVAMLLAER